MNAFLLLAAGLVLVFAAVVLLSATVLSGLLLAGLVLAGVVFAVRAVALVRQACRATLAPRTPSGLDASCPLTSAGSRPVPPWSRREVVR